MKVIYSIGAGFAGHGIGYTAFKACEQINKHNSLYNVFASYTKKQGSIPKGKIKTLKALGNGLRYLAFLDSTGYGYLVHDALFDFWVSQKLKGMETSKIDIFHGWNNHSLDSFRTAKKHNIVTVVERASAHPRAKQAILNKECKTLSLQPPSVTGGQMKRSLRELDEADYIVVPSAFAYQTHVDYGIPKNKLAMIPFGVNLEKFGSVNNKHDATDHKFIVLFVGQVSVRKGAHYLLKAWKTLDLKNAELWLVGKVNKQFKTLDIYSTSRKLETVKLLGFRKDVPEIMNKASLFVLPSLSEGSALVTYEAMAAGLPVITTFNAGSVVEDTESGFIVPVGDVELLAEKIKYFRDKPREIGRMGNIAREKVAKYTWDRYGNELTAFYKKIAEKKRQ